MEWLWTQSAANSSLSEIPVFRENTGISADSRTPRGGPTAYLSRSVSGLPTLSPTEEQGIFLPEQGIAPTLQGKLTEIQHERTLESQKETDWS